MHQCFVPYERIIRSCARGLAFALLAAWLLVFVVATPAAAAPSAGCDATNTQSIFSPPNGYNGAIAVTNNYLDHSLAYTDGEKLTISVNTVDRDGDMTVTLRNSADSVTYGTIVLSDGASATFDLPAGAVGLRFQNTSPNIVVVTNLVISCTPVPEPGATRSDVGNDFRQAARHITSRTSAAAVENVSGFVNKAVKRRLNAGSTPGGGTDTNREGGATALNSTPGAGGNGTAMLLGRPGMEPLSSPAGAPLTDAMPGNTRPLRGLWMDTASTFLDYDRTGGAFDGSVVSVGSGIDRMLGERLLAGIAVAYERGDIDSAFNNGGLESNAISLAPYIGWQVQPNIVIDANVGVAFVDYDMDRNAGAVRGEFDATRLFGAVNATGDFRRDRWRLSPSAGLLFFSERQSSYADSTGVAVAAQTVPLGRLKGGLEAGYRIAAREEAYILEPYLRLEGEWDFVRADSVTLTTGEIVRPGGGGASIAAGLNMINGSRWSGNLEASYDSIGRSDYESATVKGALRLSF